MLNITEASCVHRRSALASCQACVDACPTGAWVRHADGLDFDAGRCDGCGLCVPACPSSALALATPPLLTLDGDTLHLSCERSDAGAGANVACVHAVSEARLLALYRAGLRRIALRTGDCSTCSRGGTISIAARVTTINRALGSVGLEPVARLTASANPPPDRRGFFSRWLRTTETRILPVADSRRAMLAQLRRLGVREGPWGMKVNPQRCDGCTLCAQVCPEQALEWVDANDESGLWLRMARCTGCGLCADVCAHRALEAGRSEVTVLFFRRATCVSCGASYRQPASRPALLRCAVCQVRTRRPDRLVIDSSSFPPIPDA